MEITITQRNRLIKKELVNKYGSYNVSVIGGRGTATGWVEVHIYIEKPDDCCCLENTPYCSQCMKKLNVTRDEANKLIYAIPNIEFYTYYSDDGYNSETDCLLVQVSIKK